MTLVGEASNGREAVELWKEYRPDVTLLDLRMAEFDGVHFYVLRHSVVRVLRDRGVHGVDVRSTTRLKFVR
jgi:chemotaxis response regulator CheB